MVPHDKWVVDPGVFWRHSFGCALVCREFAERIGYNDPDKAYLAGLLHDLGIIVNSLAFTDQYREVLAKAVEAGRPLDEQEEETLGFTHCQSGVILAKAWALPQNIRDVIEWHHTTTLAPAGNPLIAITHLADLLCRVRNLGYGYEEWRVVDLATDPGWIDLERTLPKARHHGPRALHHGSRRLRRKNHQARRHDFLGQLGNIARNTRHDFSSSKPETQMQTRISGDSQ